MPGRSASQPRHDVEVRWGVTIPASDGVELSANLWLPVPRDEAPGPFPAVLEMIPYGKDSWRRNADVARGEYLAARGYALCRLDVRGTGSSGGVAEDEYTARETQDGAEAVEWLAAQPWCDGAVAMWGISYGGFTSIQVAALRPPHLRAIVPVMATDDRYLDDVHYRGGAKTASDYSQYAVSQVAMNAMPPDPAIRGPGWREAWRDRLERTPLWLSRWLREQTDGPYWRRGSLAPDYDRIEAAVLHLGGWMDEYVDPALRMQERCTAARDLRTIVGNWVHGLPDTAYPGPNIDWLHELVRFLDRHLRGIDNGLEEEPPFTWFAREWTEPEPFPARLAGRWRAAPTCPVPGVVERALALDGGEVPLAGRLVDAPAPGHGSDAVRHRPGLGTRSALSWGAGSPPNGLGRDLRPDEALSATYTGPPLAEDLEIIGFPEAVLHLSASHPVATVVVRLTDVAPDGASAQVSAGVLNLTHRRSHGEPEPLEPGRVEEVRVPLRGAGYRFLAGHRIRLSVAAGSWPVFWPSPYPSILTIHHGSEHPSRLVLPVLPAAAVAALPHPVEFRTEPPDLRAVGGGEDEPPVWRIVDDVIAGTVAVEVFDGGTSVLEDGRELYSAERLVMTAADADPAGARMDTAVVYRWREHEFATEIRAVGSITSSVDAFAIELALTVTVDGEDFFRRNWSESIPRRLV